MNKMKEKILRESYNYKGHHIEEDYVLSNMIKSFVKDYKYFGENTANLYKTLFMLGNDVRLDLIQENIEYVTEMVNNSKTPFLFEDAFNNTTNLNEERDDIAIAKAFYEKKKEELRLLGLSPDMASSKAIDAANAKYPSMAIFKSEKALVSDSARIRARAAGKSSELKPDASLRNKIKQSAGDKLPEPARDYDTEVPPLGGYEPGDKIPQGVIPHYSKPEPTYTDKMSDGIATSAPEMKNMAEIKPEGFKTTSVLDKLGPTDPIGPGLPDKNTMVAQSNAILDAPSSAAAMAAASKAPTAVAGAAANVGAAAKTGGILGWLRKAFTSVKSFFTGGVKSIGTAVKSGNWGSLLQIPLVKGALITGGAVLAFKIIKKLFGKRITSQQETSLKAQLATQGR